MPSYLKDKGLSRSSQLILEESKEKLGITEIATNVRDLGDVLSEYLLIRKERIRSQNLVNDEKVSPEFCGNLNKVVNDLSGIIQDYILSREMLERKVEERTSKEDTSKPIRRGFPGNKKVSSSRNYDELNRKAVSSLRSYEVESGSNQSTMISQAVEDMSERLKQRNSSQQMPPPQSPSKTYNILEAHTLSNFSFPSAMPLTDLDANMSRSRMNDVDDYEEWNLTNTAKRSRLPPSEDSFASMLDSKAGLSNFFMDQNFTNGTLNDTEEKEAKKPKRRITPKIISSASTS